MQQSPKLKIKEAGKPPAHLMKQNSKPLTSFVVPAPKKPRKPEDHFVLHKFKELKNQDEDEPVDLDALTEKYLREVVRLVTANNSHDEGMDRGEVMATAGDLLAQEGNSLRFKKSLVQIEARSLWKTMDEAARAPYDAKVRAPRGVTPVRGEAHVALATHSSLSPLHYADSSMTYA